MPEKLYNAGGSIESSQWYSSQDVFLLLGIGEDEQMKARAAGELAYIKVGLIHLYRGEWLLAWLDRQPRIQHDPKGRSTRAGSSRIGTARTSTGAAGTGVVATAGDDPASIVATWNQAVRRETNSGRNKPQAAAAAARKYPALHEAFLAATNSQRPSTQQAIRSRGDVQRTVRHKQMAASGRR